MRTTLTLLLLLAVSPAFAECLDNTAGERICGPGPCALDVNGRVYCAAHEKGSVMLNDRGDAVCGMGECKKGPYGGNYCAMDPGGAIITDERGANSCVGGCEPAHVGLCQQDKAKIDT